MKNKKNTSCCWCGTELSVGIGTAFFVGEEDEMLGFGPMGCTGWMAKCEDREKCKKGKQEQEERRRKEREEKEEKEKLEARLFSDDNGEYIHEEKPFFVDGIKWEKEGSGFNIYGGGVQYVKQEKYIWKLKNNGMDGDNWSKNNVRTGGAGAIGYKYEKTAERMDFLRAECENITEREEQEEREEKERKEKHDAEKREGLQKMMARTGMTIEELEKKLELGKYKTFCPEELKGKNGAKYHITIREAKELLAHGV